jgi:hypothetical protein
MTVWSHRVDGFELNVPDVSVCTVPEVQDSVEYQNIWNEIQGGPAVFHRAQPQTGRRTFLLEFLKTVAGGWESFDAYVDGLRLLFGPGEHTYEFQVRGMTASGIVVVAFTSVAVTDPKLGKITASAEVGNARWY